MRRKKIDYLPTKEELKKETKEYSEFLFKTVNELAEKAFISGIVIKTISLQDNWVETFGPNRSIHGDKYTIPAPKVNKITTDYCDIKVV